jgi:carbohydrate-selective porin OprB
MHAILPRFVLGLPRKRLALALYYALGSYAINAGHGFAESLGVDPFIISESPNPLSKELEAGANPRIDSLVVGRSDTPRFVSGHSEDAPSALPVLELPRGWTNQKAFATPEWLTLSAAILSQNNGTVSGLMPRQFTSSNLLNLGFRIGPILSHEAQVRQGTDSPKQGVDYGEHLYRKIAVNGLLTQRLGQVLSTYIPNQLNTQWNFGNGPVGRLGFLNLEYKSEGDFVSSVKVGKLMQAQDFTLNPAQCYFSGFGFCGWGQGAPGMIAIPGNPFNSYGALVALGSEQKFNFRYGIYQIAPETFAPELHGLDFSFNKGNGISQFVEARIPIQISSLLPIKIDQQSNAVSLATDDTATMKYQSLLPQGTITLGGWLGSGSYPTVISPNVTQSQNNGAYGIVSTKVPWLSIGLDHRIFVSGGIGFSPDVQQFRSGGNGGIVLAGVLPTRPFDTLSIGASYASYNPDYYLPGLEANSFVPSTEWALELNYSLNISQSIRVMPNLQIIINPGGDDRSGAVAVGGVQVWYFF